jgi:hypothetical protein
VTAFSDELDDDGQIAAPRTVGRPKKGSERSPFKTGLYLSDPEVTQEPSTSWWLGKRGGDEFRRAAADEQARMRKSKNGRQMAPLSGAFD